jgi:TolA-binding protein
MSTLEPLSPWAEGNHDDSPREQGLARLFAAVPEPWPLGDVARQRVAVRLRAPSSRGVGLLLLRLVAVGVVIGVSGAAAAQWAVVLWFGAQETTVRPQPAPVVAAAPVAPHSAVARGSTRPLPEPAASELPPEPASSAAFPAPTAAPPSSRLGQEAASLAGALSALKAGGQDNAARALRAIERHLQTFPGGSLELEARVARVDALLVLGHRQEARRELSALPIDSVGRKNELRLIRAELRADDDCRAALSDFQVLVELPLPAPWAERALFGRGACLLKLGDRAAAARDFDRYLARFPSGRFAPQIRAQGRP